MVSSSIGMEQPISGTHAWTNGNSSHSRSLNITVTDFDCSVYAHANLRANTSDGWLNVRGYSFNLYLPCEPMATGWFELQIDDQVLGRLLGRVEQQDHRGRDL